MKGRPVGSELSRSQQKRVGLWRMVRDELEEEARGWVRQSPEVGLKAPGSS